MENKKSLLLELYIDDGEYRFPSTISTAILDANSELKELEDKIEETTETVKALTPDKRAISQEQFDKSFGDMMSKMGFDTDGNSTK